MALIPEQVAAPSTMTSAGAGNYAGQESVALPGRSPFSANSLVNSV
jgi:hypothetical protein